MALPIRPKILRRDVVHAVSVVVLWQSGIGQRLIELVSDFWLRAK